MAKGALPRGLIQRLAEAGGSATEALKEYRSAGGAIRTQTWYRLWGEIENERALAGVEEGLPLNLRPVGNEIQTMTTKRASGYMQRVQVFGRTTQGDVITKTIDIRGSQVKSRQNAIGAAIDVVENIDSPSGKESGSLPVAVIGAVYGGTYELNPE